ncbi:MAG: ribosome silencing factor [Gammaproteobacteria bacterium]|nr:ribosome silencing factor [Gammaproteobacteria bacterium]
MHSKALVELVEDSMTDMKALDIRVLEVGAMTTITDFMVMASGTSDRHVRSIADRVVERAKQAGHSALGIEGHEYGEWVLVDLGDVVVHVMQPATRDFYKLENLWDMQEQAGVAGARREPAS